MGILTSKIRYEDNNETPRFSAIVSKKKKKKCKVRKKERTETMMWRMGFEKYKGHKAVYIIKFL